MIAVKTCTEYHNQPVHKSTYFEQKCNFLEMQGESKFIIFKKARSFLVTYEKSFQKSFETNYKLHFIWCLRFDQNFCHNLSIDFITSILRQSKKIILMKFLKSKTF